VKENTYIEAARSIGASPPRVMMRHILPNVVAPILILVSAGFGAAILIEGALSFLGLATQPPDASWGLMLSRGRESIETSPWLALFPGLAIAITVLSFNMLGDVVRDVLDPRLRGSR
jgi:peptide/nickel transport system permease protein